MKKIKNVILLLSLLLSFGAWTSIGLNFRATDTYVTDSAGETYVLGETTSTTRGGATFQWDTCPDCKRDRDSAVDRRLAGVNQFANSGTPSTFTLTISPGTYTICAAIGDTDNSQAYQRVEFLDGTTSLFTITDSDGTANGHFDDATGVDRTRANWAATQVCQTHVTIATTTLKMKVGSTSPAAGASTIAHIDVTQEAAPSPTPTPSATPTPSPTPTPSFSLGFNFRANQAFVADGANETYVLGETSDQFRGGAAGSAHFHWSACSDCARDRSSSVDRRLAGIYQRANSGSPASFFVTLPTTGTYTVCSAFGDVDNIQSYQKAEFYDDTTLKFSMIDTDGTSNGHFDDANGLDFTTASWPSGNTCKTGVNFTTTNFIMKLGSTDLQGNSSTISHLSLSLETAVPTPTPSPSPTATPGTENVAAILEGLGEL